MNELPPHMQYYAKAKPFTWKRCKDCGGKCDDIIGYLDADDMLVLDNTSWHVRAIHGVCASCGCQVHWTSGDEKWSRLMKRCKGG